MLTAGDGGGYGGTNWFMHDIPSMWSALAGQNMDPHWDVVTGWKQTADLTQTHMSRVMSYREKLAEAWPPEKSPASAAYLARLDALIQDLRETSAAASANYSTFSLVAMTLSIARTKIEDINKQYTENQARIDTWATAKAAEPEPQGGLQRGKTSSVPNSPPVSAGQQEQLANQARAIMFDLSSTVVESQAQLKEPKTYNPGATLVVPDEDNGNTTTNMGAVPPPIPFPGSIDDTSPTRTHPSVTAQSLTVPPPTQTTTAPILGGAGPGLAGIHTNPITAPATGPGNIGVTSPPPPIAGGGGPSLLPPPNPARPALHGSNPLVPNNGKAPQPGLIKPGAGAMQPGRVGALPPGGIIGQVPGNGGQSRPPGAAPRVNPVGGVIGGSPTGGGAARSGYVSGSGRTVGSSAGMVGQSAGSMAGQPGRGRREGERENERWDPDRPWATDEGVDPVLLPPPETGPIDPGPAIGYTR